MERQIFAVDGDFGEVQFFDICQCKGQRHLAMAMVVAVCLAVGGDMGQPRGTVVGSVAEQRIGQDIAVFEQILEGDGLRRRTVIKEHGDAPTRRQCNLIGHGGIDAVGRLFPRSRTDTAHGGGLMRRQNGVFDAVFGERLEAVGTHGRFGQPHPLGHAAVVMDKIRYPPGDLGTPIAGRRQRHDDMPIDLRNGRSVPAEARLAFAVCSQYRCIRRRFVLFEPAHQGRADIEADACIVVDDGPDPPALVEDARSGVGCVAFGRYACVPIVVGRSTGLDVDGIEPWILTRGLIKMSVDTHISGHVALFLYHAAVHRADSVVFVLRYFLGAR